MHCVAQGTGRIEIASDLPTSQERISPLKKPSPQVYFGSLNLPGTIPGHVHCVVNWASQIDGMTGNREFFTSQATGQVSIMTANFSPKGGMETGRKRTPNWTWGVKMRLLAIGSVEVGGKLVILGSISEEGITRESCHRWYQPLGTISRETKHLRPVILILGKTMIGKVHVISKRKL